MGERGEEAVATSTTGEVKRRISLLRELDSLIDFSRGELQLNIIIKLGETGGRDLTASQLSKILGERYRSVIDALHRLERKGLVEKKVGERGILLYTLSAIGKWYYNTLTKLLNLKGEMEAEDQHLSHKTILRHFTKEARTIDYIVDAIIALATTGKKRLPLETLASIMGLSTTRAQSYLDLYSQKTSQPKLFKKTIKQPTLISRILNKIGLKKSRTKVYYELTEEGLTVYHKLPYYMKLRGNTPAKILTTITRTGHPKIALKRLLIIETIGSIIALYALILHPQGYLLTAAWLFTLIMLTAIAKLSY